MSNVNQEFGFDLSTETFDALNNDLLPRGSYNVRILGCELKLSKKAKDNMEDPTKHPEHKGVRNLLIEYEVLDKNDFIGKLAKEWLAIDNPNDFARDKARKKLEELSKICNIDISNFKSPEILYEKCLKIDVIVKDTGNDKYPFNNEIVAYGKSDKKDEPKSDDEFKDDIPF